MAQSIEDFADELAAEMEVDRPRIPKHLHSTEAKQFTDRERIQALLREPLCRYRCLENRTEDDIYHLRLPLAARSRRERREFIARIEGVQRHAWRIHCTESGGHTTANTDQLIDYGPTPLVQHRYCVSCFHKVMGIGEHTWQKILKEAASEVPAVRRH